MLTRNGLASALRQDAARAIQQSGLELLGELSAKVVAGYQAIGSELDVCPLLEALSQQGTKTALPVTPSRQGPLIFRRWSPGERLRMGRYDILEPGPKAPEIVPDAILVPLLLFDNFGHRLGYGGGYYDRTLSHLRSVDSVTAIGIAYDEQQTDELVSEDHDQTLDWVLTQSGARTFGE